MLVNVAKERLPRVVLATALMAVSFAFADGAPYQYMLVEPTDVDTSVVSRSPATSADLVVSRASSSALAGEYGFDSLVLTLERSEPIETRFFRSERRGLTIILR